jgi:hypothetical protein
MSGIPDINIRRACPEDAQSIARVHVDTWKTTYAGILDERTLNGMSLEASEQRQLGFLRNDRCVSFVATSPERDEVFGFSVGGPVRKAIPGYDGELYAL